jgi:hypothetical protein
LFKFVPAFLVSLILPVLPFHCHSPLASLSIALSNCTLLATLISFPFFYTYIFHNYSSEIRHSFPSLPILIHFLFLLRFLLSLSFFFLVCDILTRTSLSTYTYLLFFFFIYNLFPLLFHFSLFSIPSSFFCHYTLL